ncbi:hypothetical protein EGW08_019459 [Elysia chlorotica]|uniref:Uncharacterized protein n=1 Tax=Elysia chlorotica TaxID=188477 RepID=A0A3S1BQZ4_ELYCH|nr:hypothetical protein EGW08_019459 [Elysia chlorotica]
MSGLSRERFSSTSERVRKEAAAATGPRRGRFFSDRSSVAVTDPHPGSSKEDNVRGKVEHLSLIGSLRRSLSLGKLHKKKQGRGSKEVEDPRPAPSHASSLADLSSRSRGGASSQAGGARESGKKLGDAASLTLSLRHAPADSASATGSAPKAGSPAPKASRRVLGPRRSAPLSPEAADEVDGSCQSLPRNQKLHGIKAL